MPHVILHRGDKTFEGEVSENTNLVVKAGIRQFPFPNLRYGCGMGKCARCACRVVKGAEHLPEPNWKEKKQLGDERLNEGFRLVCQLWLFNDIELDQPTMPLLPLARTPVDALGRTIAEDKTNGTPPATE